MDAISRRLADQSGVISRRQLTAAGYASHDIARMLRRRDLAAKAPGVYLAHTGEPHWLQRAWIGLLAVSADPDVSDVALAHRSALRVAEGPGRRDDRASVIHVSASAQRRAECIDGVIVHRNRHLSVQRHPSAWPPRIRYEEAVLDVASELDDFPALEVLTRAVGGRHSTASRLLAAAAGRTRLRRRQWLEAVLDDIDQGTHSVLEHAFLSGVIRRHGLPVPNMQRRETTAVGVVYRDAVYQGLAIELDGRLHHAEMRNRAADLDRDLLAAVAGLRTVRLGWGQAVGWPCRTAAALAQLLAVRGAHRCGPACPIA